MIQPKKAISTSALSPIFRWALGLSVIGSAVSMVLPAETKDTTHVGLRVNVPSMPTRQNREPEGASKHAIWSPVELDSPAGDPFSLPAPVVSMTPPMVPSPRPLPAPSTPTLSYRFLGQFVDPEGKSKVYVTAGGKDVLVEVGSPSSRGRQLLQSC